MANEKWLIDGNKLFELVRDDHRINGSTFSRVKEYMDDSTVDSVEAVHGHWELYPSSMYRRCSVCKVEYEKPKFNVRANYCPNCGARMDL